MITRTAATASIGATVGSPALVRPGLVTGSTASVATASVATAEVATARVATDSAAASQRAAGVPRLRLTRRGRAVLTTLAALPLVAGAAAFALNGGEASASATRSLASTAADFVTVQPGDSLWQVAEAVAPSEDTREVVAQILRANDLESADVYPGQTLTLPEQYR